MAGDDRHGGSKGPPRLVEAGIAQALGARGAPVFVERVERPGEFRDSASASLAINKRLAALVRSAVAAGRLPLVLAGSCDICMGILAGFDHAGCGLVWIDAHGDFNTPESTISGFFAGMCLAIVAGHCYRNFWAQIGDSTPVPEKATLLLGARDLDPAEEERLRRSAVTVVRWSDGRPQGDVTAALDGLARRVRSVYLHIDLDGLDPGVAPGIVDPPVAGGLSAHDLEAIIRGVGDRFRIRAAALTTYNPDRDADGRTLWTVVRAAALIAESAGG